jgi:hypothetical protein
VKLDQKENKGLLDLLALTVLLVPLEILGLLDVLALEDLLEILGHLVQQAKLVLQVQVVFLV